MKRASQPSRSAATASVTTFIVDAGITSSRGLRSKITWPVSSDTTLAAHRALTSAVSKMAPRRSRRSSAAGRARAGAVRLAATASATRSAATASGSSLARYFFWVASGAFWVASSAVTTSVTAGAISLAAPASPWRTA